MDTSTTTSWLNKKGEWSTPTAANVGASASDHGHGNLTNGGCITTAITLANNDYLIVGDSSASGKIGKGPVFIAAISSQTTSTKFLREDGQWAAPQYIANTDTAVRIYAENTNSELPLIASRTIATNITSGTTTVYGIIPGTAANIATINPSTGAMTVPGGITANLTGTVTGNATNVTGTIAIDHGGTGKTTASEAWTALGGGASGKHADSYFIAAKSSTTDNAIVRFDGTAGQVQNSTATIDDNGNLQLAGQLRLNRYGNSAYGRISFYRDTYTTWFTYMSDVTNGTAPTGGKPSSLGKVTSWALRSLIENSANYGWVWEACANGAASANTVPPTARMSLSSQMGQLRIAPNASSTECESGGLVIDSGKNASNGNVSLELWRGSNASWQIANEGGNLYFRNNWTTAKQNTYTQTSVTINYNTGNTTFAGTVTASGFSGNVTGNCSGSSGSCTGNAATATTASGLSAGAKPTITQTGTATVNLAAATTYTLTVGGQSVIFKTPADNNTNNAATHTLGTTTKYYVTGTTSATSTTSGDTYDTGVYVTEAAGELSALKYSIHDTAATPAEKALLQWNDTDLAIEFVFK